jgi:hypothetical protein
MVLLNDPASLPTPMWAVARFLLTVPGQVPIERTQSLLSPAALLPPEKRNADKTFPWAVDTLRTLGIVTTDNDLLDIAEHTRAVPPDDFAGFTDLLRRCVLDPARNAGVGDNGDQTGSKDLVRALAWFLTLDPLSSYAFDEVEQLQNDAFTAEIGSPFVNKFRWDRFVYWAPALGLAASSLLSGEGRSARIGPDCTVAVRRTVLSLWNEGEHVDADRAVARLLEELPILPGGRYSTELGLAPSTSAVSPALSFALLCGHDQAWIRLDTRSDAARDIVLVDPATVTGTRRVTGMTVLGVPA